MHIKPEVSSVRETITTTLGSRIPIVDTSEVETTVKVKDGTMIMIAGMQKLDKRDDSTGVPVLNRVPFLGAAFGSRATLKKRTEVVVFLVPHIISGEEKIVKDDLKDWATQEYLPKPDPAQHVPLTALTSPESQAINIQHKIKGLKEY